jgi:2-amino-4-hydroxy-6-hydroxymethyldihydropteridine diphosphokinase
MITCYLGLGSNLRSPERQLRQAFERIRRLPRTAVLNVSPLYFNPAVGRRSQPHYCNCAIKIVTSLPPLTLLRHCLTIEKKQQRTRKVRWGARTLDIDILLYGNQTIHHKDLTIPHPRMSEREFVLMPLSSIYHPH